MGLRTLTKLQIASLKRRPAVAKPTFYVHTTIVVRIGKLTKASGRIKNVGLQKPHYGQLLRAK